MTTPRFRLKHLLAAFAVICLVLAIVMRSDLWLPVSGFGFTTLQQDESFRVDFESVGGYTVMLRLVGDGEVQDRLKFVDARFESVDLKEGGDSHFARELALDERFGLWGVRRSRLDITQSDDGVKIVDAIAGTPLARISCQQSATVEFAINPGGGRGWIGPGATAWLTPLIISVSNDGERAAEISLIYEVSHPAQP